MSSNLFTHFQPGFEEDNYRMDFVILIGVLVTALIMTVLSITGIQQTIIASIVVPVVFVTPLLITYFVTAGHIFTSNVSMPAQATSYSLGLLAAALFSVLSESLGMASFFSLATTEGAYLSVLGQLDPVEQNIVNLSIVTWVENLFLISIAGLLYALLDRLFETVQALSVFDHQFLKVALAALPVSVFFALLHGSSSPAFFLMAASVMFVWAFSVGWDSTTEDRVFDLVPITLLFTIGYHVGHNLGVADAGFIGYHLELLFSGSQAYFMVGALEAGFHLMIFGLSLYYLRAKYQGFRSRFLSMV